MKKRIFISVILVIVMMVSGVNSAFAASYTPVDPDDQGQGGIVGGDTLTFSEDTVRANLTANWGVRVIFQDGDEWNNAELQNQLLPLRHPWYFPLCLLLHLCLFADYLKASGRSDFHQRNSDA